MAEEIGITAAAGGRAQGSGTFKCTVCFEDCDRTNRWRVDDNPVCFECIESVIVPKFKAALQHEFAYPPEWAPGLCLNVHDFAKILEPDFVQRFEQIEQEYNTPASDRVYCTGLIYTEHVPPRGTSVGNPSTANEYYPTPLNLMGLSRAVREGREMTQCGAMVCKRKQVINEDGGRCASRHLPRCWRCNAMVCSYCGEAMYSRLQWAMRHKCSYEPVDIEKAVEGLTRGVDYQFCPNPLCKDVVGLQDGCNFIQCGQASCNMGFCYLCGEGPLKDEDDHWALGKPCPKFNQPGADNALYDDVDMSDVEGLDV